MALAVVAGVLIDREGRVLLAQRPPGKPLAGLWEFPGGKLEAGESARQALARELLEELGVEIHDARPLVATRHVGPLGTIRLDAWTITGWSGEPTGLETQALAWVPLAELDTWPMPAPDRPIVSALRLPSFYVITTEPGPDHALFLDRIGAMLAAWPQPDDAAGAARGIQTNGLLQLRSKHLDDDALAPLAQGCAERARRYGWHLLINGRPRLSAELGLGLHLTSTQLRTLTAEDLPPSDPPRWLAASCHDEAEIALAAALGCDFVTVSPILSTASHPGAEPIGWTGLAGLVRRSPLPCYALGGLHPAHLATAREHGAIGIAGIGAFQPAPP